jgi:putative hemolysin
VAGLCIAVAGEVPRAGARLRLPDGTEIEVLDATPRLVRTVRLRRPDERASGEPSPGQVAAR